jgi:hypothetical protein
MSFICYILYSLDSFKAHKPDMPDTDSRDDTLVYISTALTQAPDSHRNAIQAVKSTINNMPGCAICEWYSDVHDVQPEDDPNAVAVLREDINAIRESDVLVCIYAGFGSDGRGIELRSALSMQKRVLAFRIRDSAVSSLSCGLLQLHGIVPTQVDDIADIPDRLSEILGNAH